MATLPDRDFLRELIADTARPYQVTDEFIERVLAEEPNIYLAGAVIATRLASRYASQAHSKSIGGLSVSYANRSGEYATLARELRAMGKRKLMLSGVPYAGGLDRDDTVERRRDETTLQPLIRLGMHEKPDPLQRSRREELGD